MKTNTFNKAVSAALAAAGLVAMASSVIFDLQIPAFIGLGLLLCGIITGYIATEEYVKKTVLAPTSQSALQILNELLTKLDYNGKAKYLPPRYQADMENTRVCITKNENGELPSPEQLLKENKAFFISPEWLLITAPGNDLARFFEKILKTSFTKIDLSFLQKNLTKMLVEELEIAGEVRTEVTGNILRIDVENTAYVDFYREAQLRNNMGSPLASAIACALARATGKTVTIRADSASKDQRTIQIEYELEQT